MMSGVREGLSYVLHTRQVLLVLVLVLLVSTFCLNFNVLLPVLAKKTLVAGPRTFGALSASFGFGALAGGLVAAAQGRARTSLMLLGAAGFGASQLLIAVDTNIAVACLLLVLAGVSFTTWSSNANSIVQLAAPDHLRGRVIGLYFFAFAGTGSLGGLIAGSLIHLGGTRLAFGVAGIVAIVSALAIGRLLRPKAVRMRAEEPTAERIAA
jgi:MFS family permease